MRKARPTTAFNLSLAHGFLSLYQGRCRDPDRRDGAGVHAGVREDEALWPVIVSHALLDFSDLTVDT
jgi:hypothetical protein